jgi:predicted dehydrogenase
MGRIAAGFDNPSDSAVRTHLKAILSEPRLLLKAVADVDERRAVSELSRFGVEADVVSPTSLLQADVDVLCVATPDGTHLDLIERAAAGSATTIFCEKPLEPTQQRRRQVAQAIEELGRTLVLNHSRRWIPGLQRFIDQARAGDYGVPVSATVHYCRGFQHNGVHALDLVAAFLGGHVRSASELDADLHDYSAEDPTRSLLVKLESAGRSVPMFFRGVDGRSQTVFEVDIRFERARIRVFDDLWARMEFYTPAPTDFTGFAEELTLSERFEDNPPSLLRRAWSNLADHLGDNATMISSGHDALMAYDLADSILEHIGV